MKKKFVAFAAAVFAAFFAFADTFAAGDDSEKCLLVATFTVPADWVRNIAGKNAEVISIVPANADNHAYVPAPGDLKKIREADRVFAISPHFETWFDAITQDERRKNPEKFVFLGENFAGDCPHDCGGDDPHFWTDPLLVAEHCLPKIEKALGADASEYRRKLEDCVAEMCASLEKIPRSRRKIVTFHNNMSHFAKRFGFEVAGTILASASTEAADPSARRMKLLAERVRRERISVFADASASRALPEILAKSAGVPAPRVLRADALDVPGTPSGTYLGMMRENVAALVAAALDAGE